MPGPMEEDDPSIPDTDRLFRRVPPNQLEPLEDGTFRPTSAVFKHAELSVNIECLMVEQGRLPEDTLTGYPGHYLTSIIAGDVRAKGHSIVKDTEPPNDPAHGLVLERRRIASRTQCWHPTVGSYRRLLGRGR